jgi:uracil-DNA glycosylase
MTREAPATSDPADPSGRLLRALLSSAGLSVRGDVVSAPATPAKPKKRARRRTPTPSR